MVTIGGNGDSPLGSDMKRRSLILGLAALSVLGSAAPALALVGRPLTPLSYAGVARRTTRRMVRRTTVYVATLPAQCVPVAINGVTYYQCGATYYEPYQSQYVVVQVQ